MRILLLAILFVSPVVGRGAFAAEPTPEAIKAAVERALPLIETSTQEYPYAVKKEKWAPDTMSAPGSKDSIRILEDTDGDGRADKVTIFAQDVNICARGKRFSRCNFYSWNNLRCTRLRKPPASPMNA